MKCRTGVKTERRIAALVGALALCAGAATACSSNSAQPGGPGDATPGDDVSLLEAGSTADASSTSDGPSPDGGSPIVTIADGPLAGRSDGKVYAYLGIPYAQPPTGPLRWKPPQAPKPWTAVRDASTFGNRCAQNANPTLMTAASADEDCLYLNVWTPNPTATKLPVMVWIHGGGNVGGSASDPVPFSDGGYFYDGEVLSGTGTGAVVVSLNYRLGVFGFFAHPELVGEGSKAANQGLWDQRFALQWVENNIAKFGGDPSNVTIFGESAGSFDVCVHVASPQMPPLFGRAISESGGCTTLQPTLADNQSAMLAFAAQLGCPGAGVVGDGGVGDGAVSDGATADAAAADAGADPLACLRGLDVATLLAAPTGDAGGGLAGPFGPVVDGDFLADQPRTLYETGKLAKTPYILGSNNDEGTLFELQATPVTDQAGLTAAIAGQYGDAGAALAQLYPPSAFDGGVPNPYQAALTRIVGDSTIVCSTYDSALLAANQGVSVYTYNFDIPVEIPGKVGSSPGEYYFGASHGSELSFVFGTNFQFATDPAQAAVGQLMERYWTRFAASGDPNGASDLTWPKFTSASNQRMQFALQPSVVSNFRSAECAFWIGMYEAAFPPAH